MALFRRLFRREDPYADLDDPASEAEPVNDDDDLHDAFVDDFDDEEPGGGWAAILSKMLAALLVAGLFVAVILYAYSWSVNTRPDTSAEVPLVEAEPGPEKVKPEDPGGMDVPYQDQLLLNQGKGAASAGEVERLLPPPETPQASQQGLAAGEETGGSSGGYETPSQAPDMEAGSPSAAARGESGGQSRDESQAAETAGNSTDAESGASRSDRVSETETLAQTAAEGARESERSAIPKPPGHKPEPPTTPATNSSATNSRASTQTGSRASDASAESESSRDVNTAESPARRIVIQLAAFQKRANAEAAWKRIQARHRNLLDDQKLQLQRVRIPEEGIFWRLRTGSFPDRTTAEDICGQLKKRGQACIVVEK